MVLQVDIYKKKRYWASFKYNHPQIFTLRESDLRDAAIKKFPSLQGKEFELYYGDQTLY